MSGPDSLPRPRVRPPLLLVLAVFALGAVLRGPTFARPLLSDDEAIYATTADALQRGDLLYRDVVDHKPPLIYDLYRAGFALFGRYDTEGAHLLVVLAVLATAALLLALGRDAPEGSSAGEGMDGVDAAWTGLAAAGLFLVFSTTWHDYDALAANCELFLLLPQASAAWLLAGDLRRPSAGARGGAIHLGIGALVGLSALLKYQGLTFLGASIGMLLWTVVRRRRRIAWAVPRAALQVVGAALPPAIYLLRCRAAGSLEATLFWFRFNFSYVGAGLTGLAAAARAARRTALVGGVALVPYALGLAAAVATTRGVVRVVRRRFRRETAETTPAESTPAVPDPGAPGDAQVLGLLWLATSVVALSAGGRFFGHYFHLVLPPLCLLAAPAVVRLWRRGRGFRIGLLLAGALPALAFFALATLARPLAAALDESEPAYATVAARIDVLTMPAERIFVWGNSPQLYVLARRPMGARFSFCNYMTGESPGTPTETGRRDADRNQLAASWPMLFADLQRRRPTLFVDAAAAGWDGYGKYPLARYPRLRAYVDAHYQPVEVAAGVVLYRVRRSETNAPSSATGTTWLR